MDTTLETQVIEICNETYPEHPADSPCATGNCPIPTQEVAEVEEVLTVNKGDLVIINRNEKIKVGKVEKKGSKYVDLNVFNMTSNTKREIKELVPVTVFVEKAVLDSLETEVAA